MGKGVSRRGKGGRSGGFRKEVRGGAGATGGDADKDKSLLNAKANTQIDYKSYKNALRNFANEHSGANKEYAYVISDKGYVYQYREGQAHSVTTYIPNVQKLGITKYVKNPKMGTGYTIIHNHPSGSNFSTTDLESWVSTSTQKRVVAVARGSRTAYTVTKTAKFNSKGFSNALSKAGFRMNSMKNYNADMESFLKKNAKTYGYTYSAKKV